MRRKKKQKTVIIDDGDRIEDVVEDVEDSFLLETKVNRLKVVLEKIPPGDKTILLMKYQDSMSIKEIGSILDKSESAIKMKIKRAKHKFKLQYEVLFKD